MSSSFFFKEFKEFPYLNIPLSWPLTRLAYLGKNVFSRTIFSFSKPFRLASGTTQKLLDNIKYRDIKKPSHQNHPYKFVIAKNKLFEMN